MSHVDASQLSAYNSLSDKHLAGYFANTKMRGHLRKSGLITRRGQIVSETSYRLNIARKEHKKHVKDLLAQAIVHKTLDLERHRQVAIRQKLEEIAKIELVQRVRGERNRHAVDEALLPLITGSPREKDAPYKRRTRSRSEGKRDRSDSPRSQDPRTPTPRSGGHAENELLIEERVIYVDDDGNAIDMSDCEQPIVRSGRSRTPRSREEIDARHLYSLNPLALRRYATALAKMEQTNTLASPYLIPQIPIPPSSPRTGPARHRSAGNRGRSTSSDKSPKRSPGVDLHRREPAMRHQGDIHSNCEVTMKFHGWALKLARERTDNRHDVSVEQQHCGGNTLTVFKGLIEPGSKFSFTSKRHRGYPFSLTLYVDGRQDARVSTCCEFGHSKKVRLGAKQGHFSFVGIKGMNPCYKCQVQKGMVGGKAPPKKIERPSSNPGEEVIVVQASEPPPKEMEKAKQSDEEESAHDQILVPVEVDGADARDNNEDAYESDFEDEDDSPSGRSQQPDEDGVSKVQPGIPVADETDAPKPLTGGGAVTARTDVEIEGQEADQSDHSNKDSHQGESQQPATNFSFRNAEKMEITAVEEDNVQEEADDSEADSSGSEDLVKRMRDKYKESSGRDSSSSSSSSSEEEYEAKSSSSSKSTHTSIKVVSSQKEVDDADADTADDVSDIETDVEWPRKSDEEINAGPKQRVNDALPPKPQKPSKKIQGILSPKKQKNNGQKKRTSFKMDDEEDDKSDAVVHRDKEDDDSGKEKIKKKRRSNISKEKNYEIGIVAYEEGVEQEKEEPLGLRASDAADRKKDDDQTSDIPEISVNKSGVTLFSDRVDDVEPCREHVTVGYEEEMDERGTESDVEGEGKSVEVGGGDRGTSGSETSEDMVAQYAARLTELDERAGTEDSQGLSHKVLNHAETSHNGVQNGSRENITTELHDDKESHPAAENGQEVGPSADLPKILIDSSEAHMAASGQNSQERKLSEAKDDPRNMLTSSEEQYNNVEVTLADINAKNPGGVPRRVSVGGESLLSVPCSGVGEKDCVVWTGGSHANQEQPEDEVISPRQCDTKRRPSLDSTRDDDMQQQIPIILVEGGCHPSQDKVLSQDEAKTRLARTQSPDSNDGSQGRTLSPERIPDSRQYKLPSSQDKQYRTPPVLTRHDRIMSSDTESERNSSAEAAAGSVPDRTLTSEDTGLYTECNNHTENKPSVGLMREESPSLPTIITEHVD